MKKLLNNSIINLLLMMFRLAPAGIIGAIFFKSLFILLQVLAVWMMLTWISGTILPVVKGIVQLDDASYVYPVISGVVLFTASAAAFLSKWLALNSIKRLEKYIFEFTQGKDLVASDYRNLSKLLVGLTDAFIPFIFICVVFVAWAVIIPELILPFVILAVLLGIFFRIGIRFSAARLYHAAPKVKPQEYFDSVLHRNFYKILMVPHYISLVTYTMIAIGMVVAVILMQYFSNDLMNLGSLPVITALALLQFKSFIGLLVRIGAYSGNATKIANLLSNSPNQVQ